MGESPLSGAFGGPLFVTILADLRQDVSQLGIKSSMSRNYCFRVACLEECYASKNVDSHCMYFYAQRFYIVNYEFSCLGYQGP